MAADKIDVWGEVKIFLPLEKNLANIVANLARLNYTHKIETMPVTKTAKRALRVSKRKELVNKLIKSRLEVAIRLARSKKTKKQILSAISMADRAAKKRVIHKNKAARLKSQLSKLLK
jgi:small subunit ribosomal protein S20